MGTHLVDRVLKRSDVELCVVADNLWTVLDENLADIWDPRFHLAHCDVEDFGSDTKFDEIYYLAPPASPPWCMGEPHRTISANILGALRLLDLLKPDGRIAYTSTSEVYGDPLVSPQPESYRGSVDCTEPGSSYDESERRMEALLFEMRRVHALDIRVVQLLGGYGPLTSVDDARAVSNFIARGRPITVFGDGQQPHSLGYVEDIVDGLERYFWLDRIDYPGPLNIGNGREILPPAPQHPTDRRPDLARKLLPGWLCKVPCQQGVEMTLDWFRARLPSGSAARQVG